jgi:hypothetical protein
MLVKQLKPVTSRKPRVIEGLFRRRPAALTSGRKRYDHFVLSRMSESFDLKIGKSFRRISHTFSTSMLK